jgi:hypothetical protein
MISAAFNSFAGFYDGNDTPKTYKDVLSHKNQAKWWESMKKEFHAMESNGVWKILLIAIEKTNIRYKKFLIYCECFTWFSCRRSDLARNVYSGTELRVSVCGVHSNTPSPNHKIGELTCR